MEALHSYMTTWQTDPKQVRPFFKRLLDTFRNSSARLEFIVRSGVSASLRASATGHSGPRPLYCLVDIVEDADGRWLSTCFYADTVTDPEERGNLVPQGLLAEDGYCFDLDGPDPDLEDYVLARVAEARENALRPAHEP